MKKFNSSETEFKLPLNIQFFAEPEPTNEPEPQPNNDTEPTNEPEPQLDPQEVIAKLTAELAKEKRLREKANGEASDYKHKYNDTLSEKQKIDLEKAEKEAQREAEFEQLKRESSVNKMSKGLIALGYSEEQATKASEAQLDGDWDEFQRIQKEVLAVRDKQREAEWMKKMPNPPLDNNDPKNEDMFLKGFGN